MRSEMCSLFACVVMALTSAVKAQDIVIDSFAGNGELRCTNLPPGASCTVEWASSTDGPWTNSWDTLAGVVADSNGTIHVNVPMFYRVARRLDYLVIDLAGGPSASNYPVSTLYAEPAEGWTDEYKTTKLVLRRIPAGTFTMGSPTNEIGRYDDSETQHQVTLTQDFYIGVFEVTQKQWERVMGDWPSYFTNAVYRDARPVEQVSYVTIRGSSAGAGWPVNGNVDADSFMGRLRARTGRTFDLPTESQWEYAGRAGTTTALNSGYNLTNTGSDARMSEVAQYEYNHSCRLDEEGGGVCPSEPTVAGSYLANQWGLYDIHGNVYEWCLDWYATYPGTTVDPLGAGSGSRRVFRGGGWSRDAGYCRVAYRGYSAPDGRGGGVGFRAVLPPDQ